MAASTLLVVDDDPAIRKLIGHRLSSLGYHFLEAPDGESAFRLAIAEPIDLMLLDVMMPGFDGYAVLEAVRRRWSMAQLPVIMITARDKGDDVIRAFQVGANDYVTKPIDFELLAKRVALHLSLKKGAGKTIGGYRIEHRIGAGGMGVVYAASDIHSGRRVALKVLPRALTIDDIFVRRFLREAKLASKVSHPNIVPVYETGKDDETYFISMELVEGKNLAQLCEDRPISSERAVRIARQVAEGLEALKNTGVLHRDIKPENVIVVAGDLAKITDFGIAREEKRGFRMTDDGVGVGSAIYSSPEQIRGTGDFRSDIYSLGATLFFMVTGVDPFPGKLSVDQLLGLKTARPPGTADFSSKVPRRVRALIGRMLSPRPAERFQSYSELQAALDAVVQGGAPAFSPRAYRRWWLSAAAVALGGVGLFLFWRLLSYG